MRSPPIIDRRVDIGDPIAGDLAQGNAHGADMRAHDEVDLVEGDRLLGAPHHLVNRAAGIVDRQLELATQNAAAPVDLGNRQHCAVGRGRAPDSGRAGEGEKIADAELVARAAALHEMRVDRRQVEVGRDGRQIPQQHGRRQRRTAVSREVYRRVHANSCLAPDLKAH
ncbi:hypothetical protein ACVW0I_008366 [Bradyrhizobium sp. LM6.11]